MKISIDFTKRPYQQLALFHNTTKFWELIAASQLFLAIMSVVSMKKFTSCLCDNYQAENVTTPTFYNQSFRPFTTFFASAK